MDEIIDVDSPMDAIIAFSPEMDRPMTHTVCYQVHIDPENLSPSGEFIRFDYTRTFMDADGHQREEVVNEIHGWKRVDEIKILEVLEFFENEAADVG